MNRRHRIYVSGPITLGDLAHNINQATAAFVRLAAAGLAPFCPHWSCFGGGATRAAKSGPNVPAGSVFALASACGDNRLTHADWLSVDLAWVAAADALLRLPGASVGADREVWEARLLGIPVFDSIEAVIQWAVRPEVAA